MIHIHLDTKAQGHGMTFKCIMLAQSNSNSYYIEASVKTEIVCTVKEVNNYISIEDFESKSA